MVVPHLKNSALLTIFPVTHALSHTAVTGRSSRQWQVHHIVSDWSNKELRKELKVDILSGVAAVYWHNWSKLHQKRNQLNWQASTSARVNLQFAICNSQGQFAPKFVPTEKRRNRLNWQASSTSHRVSLQHGRRCSCLALPPLLQVSLLIRHNKYDLNI